MLYQDGFKNHFGGRLMYQYTYRLSNGEYWRLSMYYTYGSMVGVCNLIFTAALFILTYVPCFSPWRSGDVPKRLLQRLKRILIS